MRFLLSFLLVFICVFATAQVPPMIIGGPQGINVKRILAEDWISIPVFTDTPSSPLIGAPWPGKGYIVHVAKANDTTVWHYTGKRWQRIGGTAENNYTVLVTGGELTRNASLNRFSVSAATYYINGTLYNSALTQINGFPKTANANGRIDLVALATTGPIVIQGTESTTPVSPDLGASRIKLGFVYYPPFDTLPTLSGNGIESVFREPGVDSIFFITKDTIIRIKDSIGISRTDTAAMLNNYKFTAANGLTKDSTVFRLGGSLNQNTNINLNSRRLTIIGGVDTTRFFSNGAISIAGSPDSSVGRHWLINKKGSRLGNLEINANGNAQNTGQGIRIDGTDRPFIFQGSAGNQAPDMFRFTNWVNDTTIAGLDVGDKSVVRIFGGFGNAAISNLSGNVLWLSPRFRMTDTTHQSTVRFRGIFYNPTLVSVGSARHIAYENTTGSNILNSTSGNTRIGYSTTDETYKFDVNGNTNVNGSSRIGTNLLIGNSFTINTTNTTFPTNSMGIYRREGNPYNTYFMESGQGGPKDKWAFLSAFGGYDTGMRTWVQTNSSIVNINLGWATPNQSNMSASTLLIDPRVNIDSTGNGFSILTLRGIYYNPKLNKIDNTTHIAYENTTGSNRLNSVSGNTMIGYNTNDTTFKLDVNGDARVTRLLVNTTTVDTSAAANIVSTTKGFLQPRMTNTQRDAITTPATGLQLFSTTDSANYVYRGTGGGWQKIANEISGSATLDFPSTNNGNKSDLTINSITGAEEGDVVALGIPNSVNLNHSCFTAWVSATNQITVRFNNYGTGALDPVSATFKVKVFK
jgi:hypothetical protein